LGIQKQGEVVNCLAQLVAVLNKGLNMPNNKDSGGQPHAPPPITIADRGVASDAICSVETTFATTLDSAPANEHVGM
jgi:hypothetical protein